MKIISKDCAMKKKLLVLLFSLASLSLVSCGGGNETTSLGISPALAQATVFNPTANGGCGNSANFGGSGPTITEAQMSACIFLIMNVAEQRQCNALGGTGINTMCTYCTIRN
jgi:hypothetical protein